MNRYFAFGLNIQSDFKIPELLLSQFSITNPDLEIKASLTLDGLSDNYIGNHVEANKNQLYLHLENIANFLIENGNRITYQRTAHVSDEELRLFILGSCLGCILQQRGYIVLHGNAITTDEKTCKIIVGHQGAGKSTTAAWHYLQGAKILADDVCAITFNEQGVPMVIPSYPQIKLWQASADLLGISTQSLRRVRPQDEKFAVPIEKQFWQTPLPLTEVTEISQTNSENNPIQGANKLALLIQHSYRYYFLEKMQLTTEYIKKILLLANQIKMQSTPRINLAQKIHA